MTLFASHSTDPDSELQESDIIFPLLMSPFFEPRPWGGRRLEALYGKPLPPGEKIGESWEISAIPGKVSRVEGGPLDGMGLDEVIRRWPLAALGRRAGQEFPLLVKFIDAAENLSVQAHPDDAAARRLENYPRGKSEAWIILDAPEGAELILGLAPGATREAFARAANSPALAPLLRRAPIRPGSVAPVEAGQVHAILADTLLCEVQQACDITYRVYDWDRQPPRALHIEKALEAIAFDRPAPEVFDLPAGAAASGGSFSRRPRPFLSMRPFSLALIELSGGAEGRAGVTVDLADGDFALAIRLDRGEGTIEITGRGMDEMAAASAHLAAGRCAFLPAALRGVTFRGASPARILWARPGVG